MLAAGSARQESRRDGPESEALGQDQSRARLESGDRLSRRSRPHCPISKQLNSTWSAIGCTTCIGNSGPLPEPVADAVQKENLVVAAVLSGNRNFEGRINALVQANYLASPPLVVAYALAGTHRYRSRQRSARQRHRRQAGLSARHLADQRRSRRPPSRTSVNAEMFQQRIRRRLRGRRATGSALPVPDGRHLRVGRPVHLHQASRPISTTWSIPRPRSQDLAGAARAGACSAIRVTTDHISPAGSIRQGQPGRQISDRAGRQARRTSTPTARAAATTK